VTMIWEELIGKKILAFRGYRNEDGAWRFNKPLTQLSFILFDDEESYLELQEQDQYDYHDCAGSARLLYLHKDAKTWKQMYDKEDEFDEPTKLGRDPFN
jgi:hypothetical protein